MLNSGGGSAKKSIIGHRYGSGCGHMGMWYKWLFWFFWGHFLAMKQIDGKNLCQKMPGVLVARSSGAQACRSGTSTSLEKEYRFSGAEWEKCLIPVLWN